MAPKMSHKFELTNSPLHQNFLIEDIRHLFDCYFAIARSIRGRTFINCRAHCSVQAFPQDLDDLIALVNGEIDSIRGIKNMGVFQSMIGHWWYRTYIHWFEGSWYHLKERSIRHAQWLRNFEMPIAYRPEGLDSWKRETFSAGPNWKKAPWNYTI